MNITFIDYVNYYRINYIDVQIKMNRLKKHPIEFLAREAGFKSKNGFYSAFKKLRNQTPIEYYLNN